jgi:hypothetical protein
MVKSRMEERMLTWLMLMCLWTECCRLLHAAAEALMIERDKTDMR